MPQYLISVWHDSGYELDFSHPPTPNAPRRPGRHVPNNELQQGRRLGVRRRPAPRNLGHGCALLPIESRFDDRRTLCRNQRTNGRSSG